MLTETSIGEPNLGSRALFEYAADCDPRGGNSRITAALDKGQEPTFPGADIRTPRSGPLLVFCAGRCLTALSGAGGGVPRFSAARFPRLAGSLPTGSAGSGPRRETRASAPPHPSPTRLRGSLDSFSQEFPKGAIVLHGST